MVKTLFVVLLFVFAVLAGPNTSGPSNWRGYLDTAGISSILTAGTVRYTAPMVLSDGEDVRILCKVRDTVTAGFATDSLVFAWGYQVGSITLDSAGKRDTVWQATDRIVVDTVDVDSMGKGTIGTTAAAGTVTQTWNRASDTLSVSGYAIQSRWVVPPWGTLIRFWANGLTGQRQGKAVVLIFEKHQRQWVPTGR